MKVTPGNILRFWKRLMFPPDTQQYRYNRMLLKVDMPWEPWLHCGVWLSMVLILLVGEKGVIPPINGVDWIWLSFGLVSPTLGFFSVWSLEHNTGKGRYYGLWGRMIADSGLAICIGLYQYDRFAEHDGLEVIGLGHGVMPNIVLFFAMWFTLTLVWRDVRLIVATEELASAIYERQCALALTELRGVDAR